MARTRENGLPTGSAALHEQGTADPVAPVAKFGEATGGKYKVRIISAGEGSSGIYPIDMLERDIPAALPAGSRMRANHDGLCEDGGDIRRVIGRTIDTPWREGNDMVTNMQVSGQWDSYVQEFGDIIGLSISMAGEYEELPEGTEYDDLGRPLGEDGEPITKRTIARLLSAEESPYNSLDFVEAPGANGRILQALESAKGRLVEMNVREQASFAGLPFERQLSEAAPSRNTEEEFDMDEQTLSRVVEGVVSRVLDAREAAKPAEPAPASGPTTKDVAEACITAGLTEQGRDAVYEAVEAGKDLAEAVAKEKAREDGMRAALEATLPQTGLFFEAGKGSDNGSRDREFDEIVGVR